MTKPQFPNLARLIGFISISKRVFHSHAWEHSPEDSFILLFDRAYAEVFGSGDGYYHRLLDDAKLKAQKKIAAEKLDQRPNYNDLSHLRFKRVCRSISGEFGELKKFLKKQGVDPVKTDPDDIYERLA